MTRRALRFLTLTCLSVVALCTWNRFISMKKTWSEARAYCREHHTDLSSISNQEEHEHLLKVGKNPKMWIGLYKDADGMWRWSGGTNASFFIWSAVQNVRGNNSCVVLSQHGWQIKNCLKRFNFYCSDTRLVLVKENKTWEEAMEHCRLRHDDLVSLPSMVALVKTLQASREAQTDCVWTSLRYLADEWLWVNRDNVVYQVWSKEEMPQCPAWTHHCGALSVQGQHWDSWDCADKLNFVCHANKSK